MTVTMMMMMMVMLMARGADDDGDDSAENPSNSGMIQACVSFDFESGL